MSHNTAINGRLIESVIISNSARMTETLILMVRSTKVLCPQNLLSRKSQRYKVWTYDICVFDTSKYYDYYWQNHDWLLL